MPEITSHAAPTGGEPESTSLRLRGTAFMTGVYLEYFDGGKVLDLLLEMSFVPSKMLSLIDGRLQEIRKLNSKAQTISDANGRTGLHSRSLENEAADQQRQVAELARRAIQRDEILLEVFDAGTSLGAAFARIEAEHRPPAGGTRAHLSRQHLRRTSVHNSISAYTPVPPC